MPHEHLERAPQGVVAAVGSVTEAVFRGWVGQEVPALLARIEQLAHGAHGMFSGHRPVDPVVRDQQPGGQRVRLGGGRQGGEGFGVEPGRVEHDGRVAVGGGCHVAPAAGRGHRFEDLMGLECDPEGKTAAIAAAVGADPIPGDLLLRHQPVDGVAEVLELGMAQAPAGALHGGAARQDQHQRVAPRRVEAMGLNHARTAPATTAGCRCGRCTGARLQDFLTSR